MKNLLVITFVALFSFNSLVQAQTIRNAAEAVDNQQEIHVGFAQLDRDLYELAAFKSKLSALEDALQNRDKDTARALISDLVSDMQREINQSERKIAQDSKEVRESTSERNASNREVRNSRRNAADNGTVTNQEVRRLKDDRSDRRDDQRDLNDDKSDLENQIARTNQQKFIFGSLKKVRFSFRESVSEQITANVKLIHEFVQTMEADIAATRLELAEDHREVREDRRERREDRRVGG